MQKQEQQKTKFIKKLFLGKNETPGKNDLNNKEIKQIGHMFLKTHDYKCNLEQTGNTHVQHAKNHSQMKRIATSTGPAKKECQEKWDKEKPTRLVCSKKTVWGNIH